jgi:hypothetical protein
MEFRKQYEEMSGTNLGRPFYFDPDVYLDAVENMIVADEIIFALSMIENMPAWYRLNPTVRAVELKKELLKKVWTVFDYSRDAEEFEVLEPSDIGRDLRYYPRITILKYFIEDAIKLGFKVNVHEFCPGNFSVLKYLDASGLDFGYSFENVNKQVSQTVDELLIKHDVIKTPNVFNIFICFEVIEHLWDTKATLQHWASKVDAQGVMISTPYGCMGGGMADWRSRDIGHVRTFTHNELMSLCSEIWPRLEWQHVLSTMQVAVGSKYPIEIKFDQLIP